MKKYFLAFLFLASNSFTAYCDPCNPFSGLFIGVSGGCSIELSEVNGRWNYVNLFAGAGDASAQGTQTSDNDGDTSYVVDFTLDYNHAFTPRKYIDFGISFFLNGDQQISSSSYQFPNPNNRVDVPRNYQVETKINPDFHMAIGLKPGYAITPRLLGFGTFSAHYMNARISTQTQVNTSSLAGPVVITEIYAKEDFWGGGLGGGVKYKWSEHWFIDFTTEWIAFVHETFKGPNLRSTNDEITITQNEKVNPNWVDLRLGLSYRF